MVTERLFFTGLVAVCWLGACTPAVPPRTAAPTTQREFEINNTSPRDICTVSVVDRNMPPADNKIGTDTVVKIKAGEQKTLMLDVAIDQTRTIVVKDCKDKLLMQQDVPFARDKVHLDVTSDK